MSYGVLECGIVTLQNLHAYGCVIKKGPYLCQTLYLYRETYSDENNCSSREQYKRTKCVIEAHPRTLQPDNLF